MTADEILKKYEDDNEYHLHDVDRKWVIAAMEEYAALHQPPVGGSVCTCKNAETEKDSLIPVYCHNCNAYVQTDI